MHPCDCREITVRFMHLCLLILLLGPSRHMLNPRDNGPWAGNAEHDKGSVQVIIAGAGGAAHLPGMVAALTPLPVIGVPVKPAGAHLDGLDALLSIVQVPSCP